MHNKKPPNNNSSKIPPFMKKCVICGFNKKVEKHHIIKKIDNGSNDEDNLVYLCLNHHWIADFGTDEDREIILNKIRQSIPRT